jgi:hypothetical protein
MEGKRAKPCAVHDNATDMELGRRRGVCFSRSKLIVVPLARLISKASTISKKGGAGHQRRQFKLAPLKRNGLRP